LQDNLEALGRALESCQIKKDEELVKMAQELAQKTESHEKLQVRNNLPCFGKNSEKFFLHRFCCLTSSDMLSAEK
jgi:hypothetical protein